MTASVAFKAAKLLREARSYLTDRNHWVKGFFGLGSGKVMDDDLLNASQVCSLGALGKAAKMRTWTCSCIVDEALVAQGYLERAMGGHVPSFNDANTTGHKDILAAFDLAIEEACKVVRKEAGEDNQGDNQ